eukprot:scaffold824_cov327-Pavlova_lutheri.AAC.4
MAVVGEGWRWILSTCHDARHGGNDAHRIDIVDEGALGTGNRLLLRHVPSGGAAEGKEEAKDRSRTRAQRSVVMLSCGVMEASDETRSQRKSPCVQERDQKRGSIPKEGRDEYRWMKAARKAGSDE